MFCHRRTFTEVLTTQVMIIEKIKFRLQYFFKGVLERLYGVPLYTKTLGLVIFTTLLIGVPTVFTVKTVFYDFNSKQLRELSYSLSKELAYQSVNYILDNDIFGLTRILRDAKKSNPDMLYAFVESPNREIIASTYGNAFPMDLLKVNNSSLKRQSIKKIKTSDGVVFDASTPILNGDLGILRVGVSQKRSKIVINHLVYYIISIVILSIMISVILVGVTSWIVMRPIAELTKATKEILKGNFNFKINSPKYNDDIGKLVKSFNSMLEKLSFLENERKEKERLSKDFVNKIITTQEDERKRIARELHDEFGQFFAYVKMNLKLIEESSVLSDAKKVIANLKEHLNKEVELLHNMVKNLRPSILDELGLSKAIEFYLSEFVEKQYDIKVDYHSFNIEKRRFDPKIEISVYRIIQEAVLNSLKHAKAKHLRIFLEWNNGILRGIIEDDGIGFNLKEKDKFGFGLYGMQERVSLLNGYIDINSEKNEGTVIVFNIPA